MRSRNCHAAAGTAVPHPVTVPPSAGVWLPCGAASGRAPAPPAARFGYAAACRAAGLQAVGRSHSCRNAGRIRIGEHDLSQKTLSNAALRTRGPLLPHRRPAITRRHLPCLRGLKDHALHAQLAARLVPFARKAWGDLQHPDDGAVRFDHDRYLKIWALTSPKFDTDFLLLDEAQDTRPVVEQIFLAQRSHAQLVMVGDSAQAIYDWRGAKDVMTDFDGTQLALSQSFRFGPRLAEEAEQHARGGQDAAGTATSRPREATANRLRRAAGARPS